MSNGSLQLKPVRGMILAFTATSSADLAHIPAIVIDIWPRLPSGDYLVELEYSEPVRLGSHLITQLGALVSELYVPPRERALVTCHSERIPALRASHGERREPRCQRPHRQPVTGNTVAIIAA
jgi:hypothetical protein